MRFRNYCLVVIGKTLNVEAEISKIAETTPNFINGGGLVIATFSSALEPKELNDWFKECNRSFFLFDLDSENSGYNITNKTIHEGLFGFLRTIKLDDRSAELLREINLTSDTKSDRIRFKDVQDVEVIEKRITEKDIDKMYRTDREELWNNIMDFNMKIGVENMSEYDKTLLQILAKY